MKQPVQCSSGHSFCRRCISQILKQNEKNICNCPICRVPISDSKLVVNRALEGLIEDLIINCPTTLDDDGDDFDDNYEDDGEDDDGNDYDDGDEW